MGFQKTCKHCKKDFIGKYEKRGTYCSTKCFLAEKQDPAPRSKKCVHCKVKFSRPSGYSNSMWSTRQFCDKKCEFDYRSLNLSANSHLWKGDKVGYRQLHAWVTKHKGRPQTCEFCQKKGLKGRSIHWANINGKYARDLDDYIRLCVKCHSNHDHSLDYLRKRNSLV